MFKKQKLYYKFCNHVVKYECKFVVKAYINSLTYLKKKREVEASTEALQITILSIY